MIEFINQLYIDFHIYAKEYPVIAGFAAAWILTVGSLLIRKIPLKIFMFIKRHTTTTLTLFNSSDIHFSVLKWIVKENIVRSARTLKASNGIYGWSDNTTLSIGYGIHFGFYRKRLIIIKLTLHKEATNTERDELTLIVFSRSQKLISSIIEESLKTDKDLTLTNIRNFNKDNYWKLVSSELKRTFDTVYLNEGIKNKIVNGIINFKNREKIDITRGVPHQLGILLEGPPGTGKTSVIKAVAAEFNMEICQLKSTELFHIEGAFTTLPKNCIVCIEDIDGDVTTFSRDKDNNTEEEILSERYNISTILNAIDGLVSCHGRILIITTNHAEKLDKALLRPGRIDLNIEISYMDVYALREMLSVFYPEENIPNISNIKHNLTPAEAQQIMLENENDFNVVLKKLSGVELKIVDNKTTKSI